MFCPKCGKEMADDMAFCPSCGYNAKTQVTEADAETTIIENTMEELTQVTGLLSVLAVIGVFVAPVLIIGWVKMYSVKPYKKEIADPELAEKCKKVQKKFTLVSNIIAVLTVFWIFGIIMLLGNL